jgi:excisionase family DNA binding protein
VDEFLTVDEIAALLKVNPQTVRNWIDAGKLDSVRVGSRRVRVRRSALDEFLSSGRQGRPRRAPTIVVEIVATEDGPSCQRAVGPFHSASAAQRWIDSQGDALHRIVIPFSRI